MAITPTPKRPENQLHLVEASRAFLETLKLSDKRKYELIRKILKDFERDFPEPKTGNVLPEYQGRKLFVADKESRVKLAGYAERMDHGGWDITVVKIVCLL